jgi:RimJ/RimL family protein N-acetyltransferase
MQGRGAGTAAVQKLLRYGFDALNLHRVYLDVFRSNVRAQRAYIKCGFVVEGIRRQAVWIEDTFEDVVMMGILSGEQK